MEITPRYIDLSKESVAEFKRGLNKKKINAINEYIINIFLGFYVPSRPLRGQEAMIK